LLAGAFAGVAVLLEYPAILAVICLLIYVFFDSGARKAALFLGGCLPFGIAILSYQYAIFGNAFELTYRHMTNGQQAAEYAQGGFGLGLRFPQPDAIWGLLFGIRRGLF